MKSEKLNSIKLVDAAKELGCEVDDFFEEWSLGNLSLCVNIVPPREVFLIDRSLEKIVNRIAEANIPLGDTELISEIVSGPFYVQTFSEELADSFVDNSDVRNIDIPYIDRIVSFGTSILIPLELEDELDNYQPIYNEEYLRDKTYIFCDPNQSYHVKGSQIRITEKQINKWQIRNGKVSVVKETELLPKEKINLLLTIGALADFIASERGPAFKSGNKPNKSKITDSLLKYVGNNIHGLRNSSVQERISKGLKLLEKAKRES
jgi:hypothetical protein